MAYIITTYDLSDFDEYDFDDAADRAIIETDAPRTRRAVATLDEALSHALDAYETATGVIAGGVTADKLTEEGGTIGPLPDGTVIEVTPSFGTALEDARGRAAFNRNNGADDA